MEEGKVKNGELELHYIAQGPASGVPVLLLHGFPQFSYMWRNQLEALAQAGYRAVAPDLRGYHLSSRPEGVENYRMKALLSDVEAFYRAFGWSQAHLVVHDWGALIGWTFAALQPNLVNKMVVIDCPHPQAYRDVLLEGVEQMFRSWYVWFFQTPEVPEQYFGGQHIQRIINWCFLSLPPARQTFTAQDLQQYRDMLLQPGQLTAAFNYYRANFRPEDLLNETPGQLPLVQAPTLLVYGEDDGALSPRTWKKTAKYCGGSFDMVALPGIGHWAAEEAPQEINRLILEHLGKA